jgi:hypothetical protein
MATVKTLPTFLHKAPSIISIVGMTGSGKSTLVYGLLRYVDKVFDKEVKGVVICYAKFQNLYTQIQEKCPVEVVLHFGLPTQEDISEYKKKFGGHWVLVCDDMAQNMVEDKGMLGTFILQSHHDEISVISLSQNFYFQGKYARSMNLQVHYLYLLRTKRDKRQISLIGSQSFPGKNKNFLNIFDDATNIPQPEIDGLRLPSYLLINMHPYEDSQLELTTSLLPPGGTRIMYTL